MIGKGRKIWRLFEKVAQGDLAAPGFCLSFSCFAGLFCRKSLFSGIMQLSVMIPGIFRGGST